MQITLGTIVDSQAALAALAALKFKAVEAFKIAKILSDEINTFIKVHDQKVIELGEVDGDGNTVVLPKNKYEFASQIEELKKQEINLNIMPISIAILNDTEIACGVLANLTWLIAD